LDKLDTEGISTGVLTSIRRNEILSDARYYEPLVSSGLEENFALTEETYEFAFNAFAGGTPLPLPATDILKNHQIIDRGNAQISLAPRETVLIQWSAAPSLTPQTSHFILIKRPSGLPTIRVMRAGEATFSVDSYRASRVRTLYPFEVPSLVRVKSWDYAKDNDHVVAVEPMTGRSVEIPIRLTKEGELMIDYSTLLPAGRFLIHRLAAQSSGLEEGILLGVAELFKRGDILVSRTTDQRSFEVMADQKSVVDAVTIRPIGKTEAADQRFPAADLRMLYRVVRAGEQEEAYRNYDSSQWHVTLPAAQAAVRPVAVAANPNDILFLQWSDKIPTDKSSLFALVKVSADGKGISLLDQPDSQFALDKFYPAGIQDMPGTMVPGTVTRNAVWTEPVSEARISDAGVSFRKNLSGALSIFLSSSNYLIVSRLQTAATAGAEENKSPDGSVTVAVQGENVVFKYKDRARFLVPFVAPVESVTFSPDSLYAIVRTNPTPSIHLLELSLLEAGQPPREFWLHSVSKNDTVEFTSDSETVVIRSPGRSSTLPIRLDVRTGKSIPVSAGAEEKITLSRAELLDRINALTQIRHTGGGYVFGRVGYRPQGELLANEVTAAGSNAPITSGRIESIIPENQDQPLIVWIESLRNGSHALQIQSAPNGGGFTITPYGLQVGKRWDLEQIQAWYPLEYFSDPSILQGSNVVSVTRNGRPIVFSDFRKLHEQLAVPGEELPTVLMITAEGVEFVPAYFISDAAGLKVRGTFDIQIDPEFAASSDEKFPAINETVLVKRLAEVPNNPFDLALGFKPESPVRLFRLLDSPFSVATDSQRVVYFSPEAEPLAKAVGKAGGISEIFSASRDFKLRIRVETPDQTQPGDKLLVTVQEARAGADEFW
jgi:hypothetical protein